MPLSRDDRRRLRKARVAAVFGEQAEAALDVLTLTEYAWHDCYGESTPPDDVVADVLLCSEGRLDLLARAALLAVVDRRDLWVWAARVREG